MILLSFLNSDVSFVYFFRAHFRKKANCHPLLLLLYISKSVFRPLIRVQ